MCVTFLCRKVKILAQMLRVLSRSKGSGALPCLTLREITDGWRVRGQRRRRREERGWVNLTVKT